MSTTVIVNAHCADNMRIRIQTQDNDAPMLDKFINDGETEVLEVYEDRAITVSEVEKEY